MKKAAIVLFFALLISNPSSAQVIPTADITPDPLVFADTLVGETSEAGTFTVTNTSSYLPLLVFQVRIADPAIFSIDSDGCTGQTIQPGDNCTIDVTFTPDRQGFYNSSLSIISLSRSIIDFAIMEGRGIAPAVTLSSTSIDFGDQTVGRSGSPRIVLLTNSGSATLNIESIVPTGVFTETDDCGAAVEPQASCTLSITFTPTAVGEFTGDVTITDDAEDSPQTIDLSGTGVPEGTPDVGLSTTEIDFGSQPVGTTGTPVVVTVTSTGTVAVNIAAVTASGNFAETNDCIGALAPDAQCTINATFTPPLAGVFTGTIVIDDDASDSPQTINLTGTGFDNGAPTADLSVASLNFGEQVVGEKSAVQTVTLTNNGTANLIVAEVLIGGDGSHSYSETDNCEGATIAVGSFCTIEVSFTPAQEGAISASVSIADDATGSPQLVALTGTGTEQTSGGGCSLANGHSGRTLWGAIILVPIFVFLFGFRNRFGRLEG